MEISEFITNLLLRICLYLDSHVYFSEAPRVVVLQLLVGKP